MDPYARIKTIWYNTLELLLVMANPTTVPDEIIYCINNVPKFKVAFGFLQDTHKFPLNQAYLNNLLSLKSVTLEPKSLIYYCLWDTLKTNKSKENMESTWDVSVWVYNSPDRPWL